MAERWSIYRSVRRGSKVSSSAGMVATSSTDSGGGVETATSVDLGGGELEGER